MQKTLFEGISSKPRDSKKETKKINDARWKAHNFEKERERQRVRQAQYRDRHRERLKAIRRNYMKKRTQDNPHYWAIQKLKLSEKEVRDVLRSQDGRCAICATDITIGGRNKRHLDHDHKTGRLRGFLCRACNHLIGNANDSPKILRAAIRYLELFHGSRENTEIHPFFGLPKAS
jgi:hypothetical protein